MWTIRKSEERGFADHGWLKSRHTFSFADYFDAEQMGFGVLRVINEDRVAPAQGFGTHGHRDMEIVSYVLEGELAHQDSLGNGSKIVPGDVQRMSAGTGVRHSEMNPSAREPVHFLQIWITPAIDGLAPSYEQRHFAADQRRGRLQLVASPDTAQSAVLLHQDVRMYAGLFDQDEKATLASGSGRLCYIHVARGAISVNGTPLAAGDGLKISGVDMIDLHSGRDAEVLVFDLPPLAATSRVSA